MPANLTFENDIENVQASKSWIIRYIRINFQVRSSGMKGKVKWLTTYLRVMGSNPNTFGILITLLSKNFFMISGPRVVLKKNQIGFWQL